MKDNLSIVILMIIFVMLIVFFPLYNYFERQDDMSYNLVLRETTTFVDKVLSNGYISNDTYQEFLDSLANTGNLYDVQLEAHKRIITSDTQNNAKGYKDYIEQYEIDYNDDILSIYPTKNNANLTNKQIKGGIYTLEIGDQFYVKLKNSSTTMAGAIFNAIISTSSTERIVVNYGGIVKNNSWKKVDANYFTDISKINTYKITYHANSQGESGAYYNIGGERKDTFESSDFLEGTSQRITPPPATRVGYTFIGYSDNANHTYYYGNEYTFNSNIDLYAMWKENKTDGNYVMNGKYYDTLRDAFSNVSQNGTTITVKKNVTGEASATLSNYYVTLILNNKTITMKERSTITISSGTLNLVGSKGKITSSGNTINLINTGNLIVGGSKMEVVSTGGIAIKNGGTGTVTITNATVSGYNIGIQNNNKKGTIKITGASKVSSNNAYKQTIQGILESTAEAIQMTNGKLILGDSKIRGNPEIVGSKFGVSLWKGTSMEYICGIVKSNNNNYSTPITPEKGYEARNQVTIKYLPGKTRPKVSKNNTYKYISITK
ncbi:putative uncharacterized protein [Clostridium sp. CAG:1219]|nr:putative uncharacterized protein [Clostridium sp. CAG:1219]